MELKQKDDFEPQNASMVAPEKVDWEEVTKQSFDNLKLSCDPNNILRPKQYVMKPKSVTVWVNPDFRKNEANFMEHWFMHEGEYDFEGTKYFVNSNKKKDTVIPIIDPERPPSSFIPVPQEVLDRIKAYEEKKAKGEIVEEK